MDEPAGFVDAEELAEVERHVHVGIVVQQPSEVVGVYVHGRQPDVRVRVAEMCLVPVGLGALLHDIVPGEYFFLLELVVFQQVERRAGERKHFGLGLFQFLDHALPQFGLCALVSLVDDDEVPLRGENLVVLVKLAAHGLRAAQVLHGDEIDVVHRGVGTHCRFERFQSVATVSRAVAEVVAVVEYFLEVYVPAVVHHRAVGEDKRSAEAQFAYGLQCADSLAEPHFCVPQHLVALFEPLLGLLHGLHLFVAQDNRAASL